MSFFTQRQTSRLHHNFSRLKTDPGAIDALRPAARLFHPTSTAFWLIAAVDPQRPNVAYGLADLGYGPETGPIDLADLAAIGAVSDASFVAKGNLKDYACGAAGDEKIEKTHEKAPKSPPRAPADAKTLPGKWIRITDSHWDWVSRAFLLTAVTPYGSLAAVANYRVCTITGENDSASYTAFLHHVDEHNDTWHFVSEGDAGLTLSEFRSIEPKSIALLQATLPFQYPLEHDLDAPGPSTAQGST